jgi:hypothetical protein
LKVLLLLLKLAEKLMKYCYLLLIILFSIQSVAQTYEKKSCQAQKINGEPPVIDGKLSDSAWKLAKWYDGFMQHEPTEGKDPTFQTEFSVLYDQYNMYVGMKMFDPSPDSIVRRLTRRDQIDGDIAVVFIDSYDDKRSAFAFGVTAAGVKFDQFTSNDGQNEDDTWNPIWWTEVSIDSAGWNAEMRIPLTQLRFEEKSEQEWGFEAARLIFRKQETSVWQPVARKQASFVSQFGRISGFQGIESRNIVDIMPYAVARTARFEKEPDNPFRANGNDNNLSAGLDAKIGITNYLTLDMTVNPDFGQVEADPSEVNLSTYETFFQEQRPFFIEGKNILNYGLSFGDGEDASEGMFYSRRIGRSPHYSPELNDGEYMKAPEFTRILGAAKITGKTSKGWSVGFLESMTAKEYAKVFRNNLHEKVPVEPYTNYAIGRIQKDFNDGNTTFGGILTAVNRNLKDAELYFLHKSAYTGGFDFVHKWNNKKWEFDLSLYGSRVAGTPEAITETQRSWIHLYQRPDASYLGVDSTKTSLSGYGGKIVLGELEGKFKFLGMVTFKSPGLEINDVGYLRETDNILQVFWTGYQIYEPFSIFRQMNLNFNQYSVWNFGGNRLSSGGNINGHTQFTNYWNLQFGANLDGRSLSSSALRGGPLLKLPGNYNLFAEIGSNEQKKLTFEFQGSYRNSFENSFSQGSNIELSIDYKPVNALKFSLNPGYDFSKTALQYITQEEINGQSRYIFGSLKRNTLSASFRININLTPELSLQYWGQPFIASGKYSHFKRITDNMAKELTGRYKEYNFSEIQYDTPSETFTVSESGFGPVTFDQPDFNVKEFLSNMVIRWEYNPGSTLYLVWSQNREASVNDGSFDFGRDVDRLFSSKANNIFLVKLSYRLGR